MVLLWAGFSISLCSISCEKVAASQSRQMGNMCNQLANINEPLILGFVCRGGVENK